MTRHLIRYLENMTPASFVRDVLALMMLALLFGLWFGSFAERILK